MDAVVAMEGNGPRNGDPRQVGAIIVSSDPVAVDATACRIMNLDVAMVGTVTAGERLGLGTWSDIEYVGDPVQSFVLADYVVNRSPRSTTESAEGRLSGLMRRFVVPKPYIVAERCTSCGTCVKVCPVDPKAVDWPSHGAHDGEHPHHDYSKCIRCYCCQEMCPERAIEIKTPPLGRLIHG
jgi:ferredoxin